MPRLTTYDTAIVESGLPYDRDPAIAIDDIDDSVRAADSIHLSGWQLKGRVLCGVSPVVVSDSPV